MSDVEAGRMDGARVQPTTRMLIGSKEDTFSHCELFMSPFHFFTFSLTSFGQKLLQTIQSCLPGPYLSIEPSFNMFQDFFVVIYDFALGIHSGSPWI